MGFFDRLKKGRTKETGNSKTDTTARVEDTIYILCHEGDSDRILQGFDSVFGTGLAGGGVNNGTLRNGDIEIQVISFGQDLGEECIEFIKKQVNMVCGHFAQVETDQPDIKINVLHQLTGTKGFVTLNYSYPGERNIETEAMICAPLYAVLAEVRGLLLVNGGSELFHEDGRLLFSDEGESSFEWYMPYERPLPKDYWDDVPKDSLRRRNESMEAIRARHIHVTEWLPLIESEAEAHFRTAEEIAGRAAALMIVALYSECLLRDKDTIAQAREFIAPIIECFGADQYFSPDEKAYLENDASTQQEQIQYIWQYEPLFVMLWALGYEKELYFPDRICNASTVVGIMKEHDSIEALVADAKLRSPDELLSAADMTYRLDWACVDTRIHGLPAPAGMDSGVVMEWHKALNWLVCGDEWDEVDTST